MKKDQWKKEEIAEDFCFSCKDGGHLRVCDFKKCLKAYHPNCLGKDDSFLEDDDRWTCGVHSCNCGKSSSFQCFCCPTSYCRSCITSAEYVQVKKNKGFCVNCLRMAKMIEEDRRVDSDGEEVDFSNTETYEFLFKDYWEIVKDQEGLTIVDVQAADALLKGGENFQNESDSCKLVVEESMSGPDDLEDDCEDGASLFKNIGGKRCSKKFQIKKSKKERAFIGWASADLVTFLASIGIKTSIPLSQVDVTEIVKEYVQSKNLFEPNKRRRNHVVPDEKLHTLFRKKKLKYHKIFDLVKSHLAEEQSDPSDGFSLSSEEDEGTISAKKRRSTNSDYKTPRSETNHWRKKVLEPSKSCHAAIVADNIKLAYLKRSLVLELLKNLETFEDKVVGCFVRIKNDPKDFYYLAQKAYHLGQVTGTRKAEQAYKIGETSTDIVLCISNFSRDIKISMISDDDIEEEDCQDLRQLAKKGLFKQPTIMILWDKYVFLCILFHRICRAFTKLASWSEAELERKVRSVHEDIVNHWINREIVKLQKQIDRANEKGWRKELNEYIDRRELLRTAEERRRLVEEIPEVIPDTGDTEVIVDGSMDLHGANKDKHDEAGKSVEGPKEEPKDNEVGGKNVTQEVRTGIISNSSMQRPPNLESEVKRKISENQVMGIRDEEEYPKNQKISEIEIIHLDDDDDDMEDISKGNDPAKAGDTPGSEKDVWHYIDPSGNEQGPFKLSCLRYWKECGYFDGAFKVWKTGQTVEDAILLTVVLGSAVPDS